MLTQVTEEDTFTRLSNAPFEEVLSGLKKLDINDPTQYSILSDDLEFGYRYPGWTWKKFHTEYENRKKND